MKQRHAWIKLFVIMSLVLSLFILSSCSVIDKITGNNGDGGQSDVDPDDKPDSNPEGDPENKPEDKPEDKEKAPEASELDAKFYDASNWVYMTNNNGESLDGGNIPYTMADGSIKFHNANQAIEMGDFTNATVSFMLKATNDFSIWLNSSSIDNANNSSYRLNYAYGQLRIALSSAPELAAAVISEENYVKGDWNRFDVVFSTEDGVCEIKVYVNGYRAELSAGDNTTPMVSVDDNILTHTQPAMFTTGNYVVVKVWEAHNFVQLKPVAKAEEEDLPIIACIGASITEGAGATNFYLESYPAQLQNALEGNYNVVNFGNSGKTVRTDLGDSVAWLKQHQWTGVQAIVPDIAILNIGTNDSKTSNSPATTYDSFHAAYKHLVDELLKVNPEMKIIVCTVPYAYSDIWDINNDNIANIIAPVQRAIAEEYGFELIDLYEYTQNKAHLFPDGVHPSTEGYEMIVKIIKKALLEGDEALTEEFINAINAEYQPKISDVKASIEIVGDKINLTVTGSTTISQGEYLKLGVTPGDNGGTKVDAVIENGRFTATVDLATLRANEWFNVRLYTSEIANELVYLAQAEGVEVGKTYIAGGTQVKVQSWDSNGNATLSFDISDYINSSYTIEVTGGSIKEENNEVILTVNGKTNAPGATLLVGPRDDVSLYGHPINLAADGSFSISFNLASLEISEKWYNVRLYMSDGASIVVPYDKLGLKVDDSFYTSDKKITVKTWEDEKITSIFVEKYEPDYPLLVGGRVSVSNMPFTLTQEGDKIYLSFSGEFGGDKKVERTIELIITTNDPAEITSAEALTKIIYTAENLYEGDSNTAFSFKINATDDIGANNDWMRFVLKVTEGDTVSYYTIKPSVAANTGDWHACSPVYNVGGLKYELAICWSSVFIQIK